MSRFVNILQVLIASVLFGDVKTLGTFWDDYQPKSNLFKRFPGCSPGSSSHLDPLHLMESFERNGCSQPAAEAKAHAGHKAK